MKKLRVISIEKSMKFEKLIWFVKREEFKVVTFFTDRIQKLDDCVWFSFFDFFSSFSGKIHWFLYYFFDLKNGFWYIFVKWLDYQMINTYCQNNDKYKRVITRIYRIGVLFKKIKLKIIDKFNEVKVNFKFNIMNA